MYVQYVYKLKFLLVASRKRSDLRGACRNCPQYHLVQQM